MLNDHANGRCGTPWVQPSGGSLLDEYRRVVADVIDEAIRTVGPADNVAGESLLLRRIREPELMGVLDRVPRGIDGVTRRVVEEIQSYRPNDRSSAGDLPSLLRICLLSQIDALWWEAEADWFDNDDDVDASDELVDLDPLRAEGTLGFDYRPQSSRLPARARDWGMRRVFPNRRPHTAGLRFTRARPEVLQVLRSLSNELATELPAGAPRIWVTSLVRSVQHQLHLRALGYAAILPSAHCAGYAADVDMKWFRQFDERGVLPSLLLRRQAAGELNVIDEGTAWHVCISPDAAKRSSSG